MELPFLMLLATRRVSRPARVSTSGCGPAPPTGAVGGAIDPCCSLDRGRLRRGRGPGRLSDRRGTPLGPEGAFVGAASGPGLGKAGTRQLVPPVSEGRARPA